MSSLAEEEECEELGLSRRELGAFDVAPAPSDFADSVLARLAAEEGRGSSRDDSALSARPDPAWLRNGKRRGLYYGAGVAAAAAAAAVALAFLAPVSGSLRADGRTELELGRRGVAVAEPGSELAFRVGWDGEAEVEQSSGDVFYRVNPGGAFRVRVPGGEARVTGTCFRVRIDRGVDSRRTSLELGAGSYLERAVEEGGAVTTKFDARRARTGAAVAGVMGAAVAAVVTITLYEGGVVLASDEGESITMKPGERAQLEEGRAPIELLDGTDGASPGAAAGERSHFEAPLPSDLDSREVRARHEALRQAYVDANARVESLEGEVASLRKAMAETESAHPSEVPFFEPSQHDLLGMVERCELRLDLPPVLESEASRVDSKNAEKLGLAHDERIVFDDVLARLHERTRDRLRALYVEATGDDGSTTLSPEAMFNEILDKGLRQGEHKELHRHLARERAGLAPSPTDVNQLGPGERAFRLVTSLGDELQRDLASALGPARAYELRKSQGGWPFSRWRTAACDRE